MIKKKTCCFFGHRDFYEKESDLLSLLIKTIKPLVLDGYNEFLFGGYGNFDSIAFEAVKTLKTAYTHIKTVYVQAYYNPLDDSKGAKEYDEILYPDLEEKIKRYAITYRNQQMIDASNFCIFFVKRSFGGAYTALKYAMRKNKNLTNIALSI